MNRFLLLIIVLPLAAACSGPARDSRPLVRVTAPPAVSSPGVHVLNASDTLEVVAARYGVDPVELAALNGIVNAASLQVGQALVLPAGAIEAPSADAGLDGDAGVLEVPRGPLEVIAPPFVIQRPPPWGWYDSLLARPGGEVILVVGGLSALTALAFTLVWVTSQVRIWLFRVTPWAFGAASRGVGGMAHEVYALSLWAVFALRWTSRAFWRFVLRPSATAVRRFGAVAGPLSNAVGRRLDGGLRQRGWHLPGTGRARRGGRSSWTRRAAREGATLGGPRAVPGDSEAYSWPPSASAVLSALERGELRAEFRPVVSVSTGSLGAMYSTPRWNHPIEGDLSEQRLSAAIQRPELAAARLALLRATLAEAGRVASDPEHRHAPPRAIIRLLPEQLYDPELTTYLLTAIAHYGIEPGGLDIGVDERWVRADVDRSALALERVTRVGVRATLIGFGTLGVEDVRRLGISSVTIDFEGALRDEKTRSFAHDAARAALALNLPVIATGVETADEASLAKDLGCSLAMGAAFDEALAGDAPSSELEQAAA